LYTGETEVADLQIAVFVDEDVARLQITVDNTSGVDVFQTTLLKSAGYSQFSEVCHTPKSGRGSTE
jgi:hypothetical protein